MTIYIIDFLPFVCPLQLEESEFTCAAAVKARKSMEVEIEDLHVQMEDISKTKQAVSTAFWILLSAFKSSISNMSPGVTQSQAAFTAYPF